MTSSILGVIEIGIHTLLQMLRFCSYHSSVCPCMRVRPAAGAGNLAQGGRKAVVPAADAAAGQPGRGRARPRPPPHLSVCMYGWIAVRRRRSHSPLSLPPSLPSLLQRFRQTSSLLSLAVRLRIYLGGKERRADRVHRCERLVAELIHHGQRWCLRSSSKKFIPLSLFREQSDEQTLRLNR